MNNWTAQRQKRERGECAVSNYAPRNFDGRSVKTGRFYIPALCLINVFKDGEIVGSFVSLFDGIDGANALLDDVLGNIVPSDKKR